MSDAFFPQAVCGQLCRRWKAPLLLNLQHVLRGPRGQPQGPGANVTRKGHLAKAARQHHKGYERRAGAAVSRLQRPNLQGSRSTQAQSGLVCGRPTAFTEAWTFHLSLAELARLEAEASAASVFAMGRRKPYSSGTISSGRHVYSSAFMYVYLFSQVFRCFGRPRPSWHSC